MCLKRSSPRLKGENARLRDAAQWAPLPQPVTHLLGVPTPAAGPGVLRAAGGCHEEWKWAGIVSRFSSGLRPEQIGNTWAETCITPLFSPTCRSCTCPLLLSWLCFRPLLWLCPCFHWALHVPTAVTQLCNAAAAPERAAAAQPPTPWRRPASLPVHRWFAGPGAPPPPCSGVPPLPGCLCGRRAQPPEVHRESMEGRLQQHHQQQQQQQQQLGNGVTPPGGNSGAPLEHTRACLLPPRPCPGTPPVAARPGGSLPTPAPSPTAASLLVTAPAPCRTRPLGTPPGDLGGVPTAGLQGAWVTGRVLMQEELGLGGCVGGGEGGGGGAGAAAGAGSPVGGGGGGVGRGGGALASSAMQALMTGRIPLRGLTTTRMAERDGGSPGGWAHRGG